jgi:hypothetical protein
MPEPEHTQLEAWHDDPGGHFMPQAPQLFESPVTSMH